MTRQKVTDPALLAQLGQSPRVKVTDPNLLAQLNADEKQPEQEESYFNLPRSILAGLTNLGRDLHNLPHDLAFGAENSINNVGDYLSKLTGKNIHFKNPHALSNVLPNDKTNYANVFGQKGEGTLLDTLVQKAVEHAPELYAGGQLAKIGIKGLIGLGEKGYQRFMLPKTQLAEAETNLNTLNEAKPSRAANFSENKNDVMRDFRQNQEAMTQREHENNQNLIHEFPIKSKQETLENLSNESVESRKALENEFNERYSKFRQSKPAQAAIKDPINIEDFNNKTEGLTGLSKTTQSVGKNISKTDYEYQDIHGMNHKIETPPENATVNDYIEYSKQLRDAAYNAKSAAADLPYLEKQAYNKTANQLLQLQKEVENKIVNTIGEKNYSPYKQINADYSAKIGPIRSNPTLGKAAYGGEVSGNIFDKLLQKENAGLREHLFQNPDYVRALREHLIQGSKHPLTKGAARNEALEDLDLQRLLTDKQKAALEEQKAIKASNENLQQASKNIKQPDLLTAAEEHQLRNFSPKANDFLNRIAHEKAITSQMEEEAKSLGISIDKLKKEWKNRKIIGAISAGVIGTAAGVPLSSLFHKVTGL